MTAEDINTVIARVEARRDRIEGEPPSYFDDLIERLEMLRESLAQSAILRVSLGGGDTVLFGRFEYPISFAVAMACSQAERERENPTTANRMLTDEVINLALRFAAINYT